MYVEEVPDFFADVDILDTNGFGLVVGVEDGKEATFNAEDDADVFVVVENDQIVRLILAAVDGSFAGGLTAHFDVAGQDFDLQVRSEVLPAAAPGRRDGLCCPRRR